MTDAKCLRIHLTGDTLVILFSYIESVCPYLLVIQNLCIVESGKFYGGRKTKGIVPALLLQKCLNFKAYQKRCQSARKEIDNFAPLR